MFKQRFNKKFSKMYPKVMKNMGRTYIIIFNIYAWYWLFAHGAQSDWEGWLQWFFACAGMNYFYQDKKKEYRFGPEPKMSSV